MRSKWKHRLNVFIGFVFLALAAYGIYWVFATVWTSLKAVDTKLAVSLLTASSTIIVGTFTVVVGKYMERQREIESHFREKKLQIYDEFLQEFFKLFYDQDKEEDDNVDARNESDTDLVSFLQEWQRKILLWGGPNVLRSYIEWKNHLGKHEPDAKSVFLMENFFRALRKDLGLSNKGLSEGIFSHLILKNPNLFLAKAKKDRNVKLSEIDKIEKEMQRNE